MRKHLILTAGLGICLAAGGVALAGGDAAAGKSKVMACAGCHGANGEGVAPIPALKGLAEADLVAKLQDYKSGKNANPIMAPFAQGLSDQDMADIAAYYATIK